MGCENRCCVRKCFLGKVLSAERGNCCGLVLASGSPQSNQGTVAIAMPDDPKEKNGTGKLKPGDIVVIELHLKHVQ